jgi:uncharacterized membrane protein
MEILTLLKIFNEEHKKPINDKNYSLDEVIADMCYIEVLLNLDDLFSITNNGLLKDVKINNRFSSIKYYYHLSDDKNLLKDIQKVTHKIIIQFYGYLLFFKVKNKMKSGGILY